MPATVLAFDIETVPDVDGARRLLDLEGLDDRAVGEILFTRRRQATGSDFLPHHLQRVVAIAAVLRHEGQVRVWALGGPEAGEAELIRRFFDGIERYAPVLVSWNGSGFDLPVLHYRALVHGVQAPRYWDTGEDDQSFRWNNYLSRYHQRHTDLMDVLGAYQARAGAPLDEVAVLLGLPGKMGMRGGDVWGAWLAGEIGAIRDYCETDALNTYLVYLRFELLRGRLDPAGYEAECERVARALAADGRPHLAAFLRRWRGGAG
ncbi:3'-5' exonuclease [Inmirania thermothiophila]|uniref:3'-5' exonuclease n=1 Tax=Inmirania thermothiophila TaxID=1750597 RepID=UPI000F48BEB6|nr:3'-5' exonuclease [Inmirania thermothiophila]